MLNPFQRAAARVPWLRHLPLLVLPLALLPLRSARAQISTPVPESRQPLANQPVQIRVLLSQAERIQIAAGSGRQQVNDGRGALLMELAPGDELVLTTSGSGLTLARRGARPAVVSSPQRDVWIAPAANDTEDATLLLGSRSYRGRLQVLVDRGLLQAINHIPLETYLMSVVGSEMPATWPQAALQAQAVAARTYALAKRRPAEAFDLRATVASQVYKGVDGETASTREAVASTRGQVLLYNNALIEAVFHSSSSSGRTESSGELWNQQLPYLVSVPDFDANSPVHNWRARFEPDQLRRLFPETGGVQRIDVLTTSSSGRIRRVRIVGPLGSQVLTGAELRLRLGLRSTLMQMELIGGQPLPASPAAAIGSSQPQPLTASTGPTPGSTQPSDTAGPAAVPTPPPLPPLTIVRSELQPSGRRAAPALVVEGQGFGHGVGLSQWGAYGMALQGKGYGEILMHYYRGVELKPYSASTF